MWGIVIRANDRGRAEVACRSCGAVIFDDTNRLANLALENLSDGRTRVRSLSFGVRVHLCADGAVEASVIAEAEHYVLRGAYEA